MLQRFFVLLIVASLISCQKDCDISGCQNITIVVTNNLACDAQITLNGEDLGTLESDYWQSFSMEPRFYSLEAVTPSLICGDRSLSTTQNDCGGVINFLIN